MAAEGALIKMIILAFDSAEDAESGGLLNAKDIFKVLINPESYTLDLKLSTADSQAPGTSGTQSKFNFIHPEELTFEFLFDNTGIIDGVPRPGGIDEEVSHFRNMLMNYKGEPHEPFHLKLIWGNFIFKGRATEVSITYKLFNAAGLPIRAVAKVKFKASVEEKKRATEEGKTSADLTHLRNIKAGDTLPLLCQRIYGHPKYYLEIAKFNGLNHFSALKVGSVIKFPPFRKSENNGR